MSQPSECAAFRFSCPADASFIHLLLARCPIDLPPALYLLSNHLRPTYLPCELGIGSMILTRAIKDVSGLQARDLKRLWSRHGDPGDVAYEAKVHMRTLVEPAPLVVHDVYKRVLKLADIRGPQSGKLKGDAVRKLMVQSRGDEVRYLVRTLIGNLRVGPPGSCTLADGRLVRCGSRS